MAAKLAPGPELWLANLDIELATASDVARLHALAMKSFEVRSLQRQYFKEGHSHDVLLASKQAERQLDDLLSAPAQGGLDL